MWLERRAAQFERWRRWQSRPNPGLAVALLGGGLLLAGCAQAPDLMAGTKMRSDPFDRLGNPNAEGREGRPLSTPTENCFWSLTVGPDPAANQYYTDQASIYPSAVFPKLPEGAELELKGEFNHARFFSFTSYFPGKTPTGTGGSQSIIDEEIVPDAGSVNPFVDGAPRDGHNSYSLHFVQRAAPAASTERLPNTFYLGDKTFPFGNALVMRLYVNDKNSNELGGTTLPRHILHTADGRALEGEAACKVLGRFNGHMPFPSPAFKQAEYRAARDDASRLPSHPAVSPPVLRRLWTVPYNFCLDFKGVGATDPQGICGANPASDPNGQGFANPRTGYLNGWINTGLGEVLVFRGKKPRTPRTYFGEKLFKSKGTDMRYYSWCTQESMYSWRVADCVFDEEMPTDKDGFYTVVISRPSYRPHNARYECGYAWLQPPPAGDGFGDIYLSQIQIRQMNQAEDFPGNLNRVKAVGQEAQAMGDYFPKGVYMSKAEFEEKYACHAPTSN